MLAFILTVLIGVAIGWFAARLTEPAEPEWVSGDDDELDQDTCSSPLECASEFAVISGTGAGWGVYQTFAEAEARRANVAVAHPGTHVFYRGTCS